MNSAGERRENLFNNLTSYFPIFVGATLLISLTALLIFQFGTTSQKSLGDIQNSSRSKNNLPFKTEFEKEISSLNELLKKDPKNAENNMLLGMRYKAIGKLDLAIDAFEKSLSANPNQPEIFYNLATIFNYGGNTERAIEAAEKAVALNESFIGAKILLGDLYLKAGDKKKARQQYQNVVDKKPNGSVLDQAKVKLESLEN